MAAVNFYLKNPKANEPTLIYVFFSYNGSRLKYSTGEKIHPKYWLTYEQRAKKNLESLNDFLNKTRNALFEIERKTRIIGITPTNEYLRKELSKEIHGKTTGEETLLGYIKNVSINSKTSKKPNTLKTYTSLLNHLIDFQEKKRYNVDFGTLNLDFYDHFIVYLQTKEKPLSNNSVGKYISALKAILNDATEHGYNKNVEFRSKRFKVFHEQPDKIYLAEDELKSLYELDLSSKPNLERVRDLFITGCYTGLRFSDFSQITPENIYSNTKGTLIKIRTQKTDEVVDIPFHPLVKRIYKKYGDGFPRSLSNQKMNKYLKVVGRLAKIDNKIRISKNTGAMRVDTTVCKYDLITTHTARRSFATNLYLAGFPAFLIMKITGHRTETAFHRYIRVKTEEAANKLIEFWDKREAQILKVI